MVLLIYPLLFGIILLPDPGPRGAVLEDFTRIDRAVGESIYVVDRNGSERVGQVVGVDDRALRLQVGPQVFAIDRSAILAADRRRDRTTDGVIKGALFGLIAGLFAIQGTDGSGGEATRVVIGSMAIYGSIGYAFDRANHVRTPLYRAPRTVAAVTVKF
jgi:hypothetical protein